MKKRVLVIDDDEDILSILNIIFEDEGYEVICSTKEATSEEIRIIHPDIVLLDVRLKGSSRMGDEICRDIKSYLATKHLPVILISGEYNVPYLAAQSGANGYIHKPFDVTDIVSRVREFIN